jgi:glycosyltransferase involved in cell wall biosynthesis
MTADTIGGVWTFAIELAASLMARGISVVIATSGGPLSREQRAQARNAGDPEIFESNFKLEWQDEPWAEVDRAGEWLHGVADRVRPDLLHLSEYSNAAGDWELPVVVTAHSCVCSWYAAVKKCAAPAQWNEYRKRVARGLRAADIVTAPSRAMLYYLEDHYGSLARAIVIRNGRRADHPPVERKEPFILAAGRIWDEAKNIAALARIAPRLPWPVYVAGDTKGSSFSNVRTLGYLATVELFSWMSRASIYCLPAKYEPFGLSILEAALADCALVLGDIDSLREIWSGSAHFVDPNDPEALVETLRELISNRRARAISGEQARKRARLYDPERMTDGYMRAYAAARETPHHPTLRGAVLSA